MGKVSKQTSENIIACDWCGDECDIRESVGMSFANFIGDKLTAKDKILRAVNHFSQRHIRGDRYDFHIKCITDMMSEAWLAKHNNVDKKG